MFQDSVKLSQDDSNKQEAPYIRFLKFCLGVTLREPELLEIRYWLDPECRITSQDVCKYC